MHGVSIGEHSTAYDGRKMERLLGSPKAGALYCVFENLFDKEVTGHESNISYFALAVGVAGDGCIATPNRMVVVSDYRCGGGRKQFHPPTCRVVCDSGLVGIVFKQDPFGDGELAVSHTRSLGDEARLCTGAYPYILVAESTLEGVEQVTSGFG